MIRSPVTLGDGQTRVKEPERRCSIQTPPNSQTPSRWERGEATGEYLEFTEST